MNSLKNKQKLQQTENLEAQKFKRAQKTSVIKEILKEKLYTNYLLKDEML